MAGIDRVCLSLLRQIQGGNVKSASNRWLASYMCSLFQEHKAWLKDLGQVLAGQKSPTREKEPYYSKRALLEQKSPAVQKALVEQNSFVKSDTSYDEQNARV